MAHQTRRNGVSDRLQFMPRTARRAGVPSTATAAGVRTRSDKYFSKVVGKALDIIAILRSTADPLPLHDLTLRLDLAKSSVFRILHTLEVSGYVERDNAGRYSVAADLRDWAPGRLRASLVDATMPALRELSREFCETVTLAMHFENRIEVVATVESPHLIRMGNTVGRIVPPHASSLGKAITAFQREEVRDRLIRGYGIHRFTDHTITDEMELKREFERIRSRGYSTDADESVVEGMCFGAPILSTRGDAVAAISLSAPRMRMRDEQLQKRVVAALRRAADGVSRALASRTPR
jgi:IclR family acetate operon transcriptional repressor